MKRGQVTIFALLPTASNVNQISVTINHRFLTFSAHQWQEIPKPWTQILADITSQRRAIACTRTHAHIHKYMRVSSCARMYILKMLQTDYYKRNNRYDLRKFLVACIRDNVRHKQKEKEGVGERGQATERGGREIERRDTPNRKKGWETSHTVLPIQRMHVFS